MLLEGLIAKYNKPLCIKGKHKGLILFTMRILAKKLMVKETSDSVQHPAFFYLCLRFRSHRVISGLNYGSLRQTMERQLSQKRLKNSLVTNDFGTAV